METGEELSIDIHMMTLMLPKSEYCKVDFIRFVIYALSSNDETLDHLETLFETGPLTDQEIFESIHKRLDILAASWMIFLQSIQEFHLTPGNHVEEPYEIYTPANYP